MDGGPGTDPLPPSIMNMRWCRWWLSGKYLELQVDQDVSVATGR